MQKGILLVMTVVYTKLIETFLTDLLDKYLFISFANCKIEMGRITAR